MPYDFRCSYVNNFIFSFSLHALLRIHKPFSCNLSLCINHALYKSMVRNEDIVGIVKPDGISWLTFVVDAFSGLFLHPWMLSVKHSRSA